MVVSAELRRWRSSSIIFLRRVTGTPPVTHTYIKPSSNQRSNTSREAFAAGRLRSSRVTGHVVVRFHLSCKHVNQTRPVDLSLFFWLRSSCQHYVQNTSPLLRNLLLDGCVGSPFRFRLDDRPLGFDIIERLQLPTAISLSSYRFSLTRYVTFFKVVSKRGAALLGISRLQRTRLPTEILDVWRMS